MADEKKTLKKETAAAEKKSNKFVAFFKALPQKIATPFKNMWHELKKVTWPTRKELINVSLLVLAFMAIMGVVIGVSARAKKVKRDGTAYRQLYHEEEKPKNNASKKKNGDYTNVFKK